MGRLLTACLLAIISAAATCPAQIIAIHLKPEAVRKHRKHIVLLNGQPVVAGEIVQGGGMSVNMQSNTINYAGKKGNAVFAADPGNPAKLPYVIKNGERVFRGRKSKVSVAGTDIIRLTFMMRDQTLHGLATEYELKKTAIDEQINKRKKLKKGTNEWLDVHRDIIGRYKRLISWLDGTLYPRLAKKMEKTVLKELKLLKDDAMEERAHVALKSIKKVEVDPDLVSANQALAKGGIRFGTQESQHCRIVYDLASVKDGSVAQLLKLSEQIIEGFRREFIEPYINGEDLVDVIPEDLFIEFWFGPSEISLYRGFWTDFYGRGWGSNEKERLKMAGTRSRFARGVNYVDYWKSTTESDHQGMVAHGLGHALCNLWFNNDGMSGSQAWLAEAVGYYISFEYLGRNSVTCKQFQKRTYARDPGAEGLKTVAMGQRAAFNELALRKGSSLNVLAGKTLYQMEDGDLAKAWSMFDFIANKEGLNGILFLKSACANARDKSTFIKSWVRESIEIYKTKGANPLNLIEKRWRDYASVDQMRTRRKKR